MPKLRGQTKRLVEIFGAGDGKLPMAGTIKKRKVCMSELPSRPNPESLLAQARLDPSCMGRLFDGYSNYLTLLARVQIGRRLQGKVDAADLVQETFLEAVRHFGRFRGTTESEFTSWLRRILAGRLAKVVRRYWGTRARDLRLETDLADELAQSSRCLGVGLVAPQSTPSQQMVRREEAVVLANLLEQLNPAYREVLVMRHLEGLTFPEIAGRMRRSIDSVEKLWARALGKLRQAWESLL
jgi:RNA polymerase sigma-70 factor (ECF subfamily)